MSATVVETSVRCHHEELCHHEFFMPGRPLASRSRTPSASSEGNISITSTCSSRSTTSSTSSQVTISSGFIKGIVILTVCLSYAFTMFFIVSLAKALSFILRTKGNKHASNMLTETNLHDEYHEVHPAAVLQKQS